MSVPVMLPSVPTMKVSRTVALPVRFSKFSKFSTVAWALRSCPLFSPVTRQTVLAVGPVSVSAVLFPPFTVS